MRGREKAEQFRASVVFPKMVRDLLLDIETFGRGADSSPLVPKANRLTD